MRHEHLVVTVEAGLKDRIDDDLDSGESLESWVADAIERKLAENETERRDPRRAGGEPSSPERGTTDRERDTRFGTRDDDGRGGRGDGGDDESGNGDAFDRRRDGGFDDAGDYDEGFEYVDDCSI